MSKTDTTKMTVYLRTKQYEALRREAFNRRTKITALVRKAVDFWLEAGEEKKR